jgi:hypothetical protein
MPNQLSVLIFSISPLYHVKNSSEHRSFPPCFRAVVVVVCAFETDYNQRVTSKRPNVLGHRPQRGQGSPCVSNSVPLQPQRLQSIRTSERPSDTKICFAPACSFCEFLPAALSSLFPHAGTDAATLSGAYELENLRDQKINATNQHSRATTDYFAMELCKIRRFPWMNQVGMRLFGCGFFCR